MRRFAQLVGIFPVGNLVRLDTGEIAVVVTIYAPDPYQPQVRVIVDKAGVRIEHPYDINLWENGAGQPTAVAKPLDPLEFGIDPLTFL